MTNDDLLMDLADCGSPETLVAAILKHHPDLPRQVPVETIAASVGITDIQNIDADSFEGALVANPEKTSGIIATKQGLNARRRRFTIGHELGHFLIRSHGANMQCNTADMREQRRDTPAHKSEYEANRFSAGLLMPKPMFVKDMDALGSADVTHAKNLSDLYQVSLEATANRAFVFSKDGLVRYARPSRSMPDLSVRNGDRLPPSSQTARTNAVGIPSKWETTVGSLWLRSDWNNPAPAVLEQCVVQSNGYRVTLLFVDQDEVVSREEEDELERSWTPRFRR
jgi:Zn-dependent peptidase ImmA (M78 family)